MFAIKVGLFKVLYRFNPYTEVTPKYVWDIFKESEKDSAKKFLPNMSHSYHIHILNRRKKNSPYETCLQQNYSLTNYQLTVITPPNTLRIWHQKLNIKWQAKNGRAINNICIPFLPQFMRPNMDIRKVQGIPVIFH